MNLVGNKVIHTTYGEGTIIGQDRSYVLVKFAKETEIIKFLYPTCFKTFLTLVDSEVASVIECKINEYELNEQKQKEKKRYEAEKRAFERSLLRKPSGRNGKSIQLHAFTSIDSFFEQYGKSLNDEITYLKKNGGKHQKIFDGKLIERKYDYYIYSFEADSELNYPDGTPIILWQGTNGSSANIVTCEEFTIIIETSKNFGTDVDFLEFSAESWRLIEALNERLTQLHQNPLSTIVQKLICAERTKIQQGKELTKGQFDTVRMAQCNPIVFVWGPPGTGKTETLAKIALEHIKRGNRVLMLSYSNVSVDGAILRVKKLDKAPGKGKLVRYGYARDKELQQHEYLTSYNLAIRNHPILNEERKSLQAELKKTSRISKR